MRPLSASAMTVEAIWILVEEPSAAEVLETLLPKILEGSRVKTRVIRHSCRSELLERLPQLFSGYARSLPDSIKILVLLDKDRQDCRKRKGDVQKEACKAGLSIRGSPLCRRRVIVRIAVEELEAWFFGDWQAVVSAFPGVPSTLPQKRQYRNPDAVGGGTKEAFDRILQRAGYYKGVKEPPRLEVSRRVAQQMEPRRNNNPSFRLFRDTLRQLAQC